MKVLCSYKDAPFTQDRWINLVIDGQPKSFFCKVIPPGVDKRFTYILPEGFPRELIRVIFGPNVRIEEADCGTHKAKRRQGKSNALPPAIVESTR